jgi:hypothetical protein
MPLSAAICSKSFSDFSISCLAFSLLGLLSLLLFGDEQERRINNRQKDDRSFFHNAVVLISLAIYNSSLVDCWCGLHEQSDMPTKE